MTTFDFKDGKGPVLAHQHPNGGGWVADTANVSDKSYVGQNAQVFGNASVHEKAKVFGDAKVSGNAWVSGNAQVFGDAKVSGNAKVYGNAKVHEKAKVFGDAKVSGNAWVFGDAQVSGNASVYGGAEVHGNAQVHGNAKVHEKAEVFGDAQVFGDAIISKTQHVTFGSVIVDLSLPENLSASIEAQCNLGVVNGWVYCYKRVCRNLSSEYDSSFFYPTNGIVSIDDYDPNINVSCGAGLHFSHLTYFTRNMDTRILLAKVAIEDVITCLEGKIRVKKAEILGVVGE